MDDRMVALREKKERLLREAAEVDVELARLEGAIRGVLHYSVIEGRGHELGQELSRAFQQRQMAEVVAAAAVRQRCPECGSLCPAAPQPREMTGLDGRLELLELKSHCPRCRRDLFSPCGKRWDLTPASSLR